MREQVANRHSLFPRSLKRRDVALYRRIDLEFARVHEHHHSGRESDDFGEGGEIVDGFIGDRARVVNRVMPEGKHHDWAMCSSYDEHAAGKCAVDLPAQIVADGIEAIEFLVT